MIIENCRVAIADDESMTRYVLKSIIKSLGMDCVGEAANGQEAVALYAKQKPDIMFLDVNMPIQDGDKALKEIRDGFPNAKIVMLTAVADMETVEKCIRDGAINYILKTNPMDEIEKLMKKIVQGC